MDRAHLTGDTTLPAHIDLLASSSLVRDPRVTIAAKLWLGLLSNRTEPAAEFTHLASGEWGALFRLLERLDDPRLWSVMVDRYTKLSTQRTTSPQLQILVDEYRMLLERVGARWKALPTLLSDRAETILDRLAERFTAHPFAANADGMALGRELLESIYDNPADDAPRWVYADWLLEREDPRGAFILRQLQGKKRNVKERTAESSLLVKYREKWLGSLLSQVVPESVQFRRGFPAVCTLKPRVRNDPFGPRAEWATIEELRCDVGGVLSPQLRSLRRLYGIDNHVSWSVERFGLAQQLLEASIQVGADVSVVSAALEVLRQAVDLKTLGIEFWQYFHHLEASLEQLVATWIQDSPPCFQTVWLIFPAGHTTIVALWHRWAGAVVSVALEARMYVMEGNIRVPVATVRREARSAGNDRVLLVLARPLDEVAFAPDVREWLGTLERG